jgi:hypothetical protein
MMEQLIESTTIQIEQHIEPSQELKTANMDKVSDMLNNLRRSNPE